MTIRQEVREEVKAICASYKDEPSPLMMILSTIQKKYGYIPLEVQQVVSEETGNVLSFKDAIALVNLNLVGSVKLSSVKLRALGGETLSGLADYSYASGALSPKASLSEAVVNCTNNGSFVQLYGAGTKVPVLIAPGSFGGGLEITAVTDNHLVMHKTLTPGEIKAGGVYAQDVVWKADENVLFFEVYAIGSLKFYQFD